MQFFLFLTLVHTCRAQPNALECIFWSVSRSYLADNTDWIEQSCTSSLVACTWSLGAQLSVRINFLCRTTCSSCLYSPFVFCARFCARVWVAGSGNGLSDSSSVSCVHLQLIGRWLLYVCGKCVFRSVVLAVTWSFSSVIVNAPARDHFNWCWWGLSGRIAITNVIWISSIPTTLRATSNLITFTVVDTACRSIRIHALCPSDIVFKKQNKKNIKPFEFGFEAAQRRTLHPRALSVKSLAKSIWVTHTTLLYSQTNWARPEWQRRTVFCRRTRVGKPEIPYDFPRVCNVCKCNFSYS